LQIFEDGLRLGQPYESVGLQVRRGDLLNFTHMSARDLDLKRHIYSNHGELPKRKTVTLRTPDERGAKSLVFFGHKRLAVGNVMRKSSALIFSPCHELTDVPGFFADIEDGLGLG
jgi:hypothetical protein